MDTQRPSNCSKYFFIVFCSLYTPLGQGKGVAANTKIPTRPIKNLYGKLYHNLLEMMIEREG
jgi:hypothetical protein